MSTHGGYPLTDYAPAYQGTNHPVNWVDWAGSEILGVSPQAAMRGHPPALSWWMQRPSGVHLTPQPTPAWMHSRPYDRGAGAYAPKFGTLTYNPIGAGVYAPYRIPTIAGPGARYQYGAIWFDVQTVPTSIRIDPTVPMQSVNAMVATSYVAAGYRTTG